MACHEAEAVADLFSTRQTSNAKDVTTLQSLSSLGCKMKRMSAGIASNAAWGAGSSPAKTTAALLLFARIHVTVYRWSARFVTYSVVATYLNPCVCSHCQQARPKACDGRRNRTRAHRFLFLFLFLVLFLFLLVVLLGWHPTVSTR